MPTAKEAAASLAIVTRFLEGSMMKAPPSHLLILYDLAASICEYRQQTMVQSTITSFFTPPS